MIEFHRKIRDEYALVMGIGSHACEAVSQEYYDNENPAIDFMIVDSNREVLKSFIIPSKNKIWIGTNTNNESGWKDESNSNREAEGEGLSAMERLISKGYQVIFLLTTLDGETGTALSKLIAQRCMQTNTLVVSAISYPYYLKGSLPHFKELSGLNDLSSYSDLAFVISGKVRMQR